MKYLIFLLSFAVSAQTFTFIPPTQWDDGFNTPMPESAIVKYKVYLNGVFLKDIPPIPYSFDVDIVGSTNKINLSTVANNGRNSLWSETLTLKNRPGSPVIQ